MGKSKNYSASGLVLGLDIGPNSVGWALVREEDSHPVCLESLGVRVFEAGLDDLKTDGKGKSRNETRREARLSRRGAERRVRRLIRIANLLQRAGLLVEGNFTNSEERHLAFNELDRRFGCPYMLRARALDSQLANLELGWALFHLAHRRGFLSNRRSSGSSEEDEGIVKAAIGDLAQAIQTTGCRTLGEFLSKVDSHTERIRGRYTSRAMYEHEFGLIWESQRQFYPDVLTDSLKQRLHKAIFFQRPLKSQARFVGYCEYEENRRRAPWALLAAQRFRYLQTINNLRMVDKLTGEYLELTREQREKLIQACETNRELPFSRMRQLLGLKRTAKFNLEEGGEKRISANKTGAALAEILGMEKWSSQPPAEQDAIVEDLLSIVNETALKNRARKKWGLSEEAAGRLGDIRLEDGYCRLSRQALARVLPGLREGKSLQTIFREEYPGRWERQTQPLDCLPPIRESGLSELRNPIVERALTEVRRVVNAIIARWGKPARIQIELGRELRQTARQRFESTKKIRANEKARKDAADRLLREAGIEHPGTDDLTKVLLADECDWTCPYTGRNFGFAELFGPHPQYHIEHIIPHDRSLDNSFLNKTLCHETENRQKADRTPWEAYHGTEKWQAIIERVKAFKGSGARAKLTRFQMNSEQLRLELEEFTSRQLNDMRWTSRWAKQYLGLLYGGLKDDGIDSTGKRRLVATTGPVTAILRRLWGLNGILGTEDTKSRDDHRHHVVDAVTTALASASWVQRISRAARDGRHIGRDFTAIEFPWDGFRNDIERAVVSCVTSHRISHRVRGALHKDTFYGPARFDENEKEYVHKRVSLRSLKKKDIDNIIDPVIREIVQKAWPTDSSDEKSPFADRNNHPRVQLGDGQWRTIHSVRVRDDLSTLLSVGTEHRMRRAASASTHHMAVYEETKNGEQVWDGSVVTLFEACERKRRKEPVINRVDQSESHFVFSLAWGDPIELDVADGERRLFVVRKVGQNKQILFVSINDARPLVDIPKVGQTARPSALLQRNCRKVTVTVLGEVRRASD